MSTWYQVYIYDQEGRGKCFGFKTDGIKILDHPDWLWKGKSLLDYKRILIDINAKVYKIADVCGI